MSIQIVPTSDSLRTQGACLPESFVQAALKVPAVVAELCPRQELNALAILRRTPVEVLSARNLSVLCSVGNDELDRELGKMLRDSQVAYLVNHVGVCLSHLTTAPDTRCVHKAQILCQAYVPLLARGVALSDVPEVPLGKIREICALPGAIAAASDARALEIVGFAAGARASGLLTSLSESLVKGAQDKPADLQFLAIATTLARYLTNKDLLTPEGQQACLALARAVRPDGRAENNFAPVYTAINLHLLPHLHGAYTSEDHRHTPLHGAAESSVFGTILIEMALAGSRLASQLCCEDGLEAKLSHRIADEYATMLNRAHQAPGGSTLGSEESIALGLAIGNLRSCAHEEVTRDVLDSFVAGIGSDGFRESVLAVITAGAAEPYVTRISSALRMLGDKATYLAPIQAWIAAGGPRSGPPDFSALRQAQQMLPNTDGLSLLDTAPHIRDAIKTAVIEAILLGSHGGNAASQLLVAVGQLRPIAALTTRSHDEIATLSAIVQGVFIKVAEEPAFGNERTQRRQAEQGIRSLLAKDPSAEIIMEVASHRAHTELQSKGLKLMSMRLVPTLFERVGEILGLRF